MRELNELEIRMVGAAISDFDILSLSVMSGTLLGAGLGTYMALGFPVLNIWQLFLFPVWVAAGAGVGGMLGLGVGMMAGVGGICAHHLQ